MESFLQSFHSKYPGCTPRAMAAGLTEDGLSSYEVLTELVPREGAFHVLDLACGDGFLLELLSGREQKGLELIGVDQNEAELAAARTRGIRVDFHLALAQAIPLRDHSVDFVLCHMAFMLMPEVDQVVQEVTRVLKPGGTFAAIVGAPGKLSTAHFEFVKILDEELTFEEKTYLKGLGDLRVRSVEGLRSLFEGGFQTPIAVEDFSLSLSAPPEIILPNFNLTYDVDLLSEEGRKRLEGRLLKTLRELKMENGLVQHGMNLRKIFGQIPTEISQITELRFSS